MYSDRNNCRSLKCFSLHVYIPNHAFHYAKFQYRNLEAVEKLVTIVPDKFEDPLADVNGGFDCIVLVTVFEHLDEPERVVRYLTDRLNPGGVFVFDYVYGRDIITQ